MPFFRFAHCERYERLGRNDAVGKAKPEDLFRVLSAGLGGLHTALGLAGLQATYSFTQYSRLLAVAVGHRTRSLL